VSEPHSPASEHNKPMVPTAATSPTVNPLLPLRRHIGQSLDGAKSCERRAASAQRLGNGQ